MAFLAILGHASAAPCNLSIMMVEIERPSEPILGFARRALILEGTGGTYLNIEAGQVCFLAFSRFDRHPLAIGAGDFDGYPFI